MVQTQNTFTERGASVLLAGAPQASSFIVSQVGNKICFYLGPRDIKRNSTKLTPWRAHSIRLLSAGAGVLLAGAPRASPGIHPSQFFSWF